MKLAFIFPLLVGLVAMPAVAAVSESAVYQQAVNNMSSSAKAFINEKDYKTRTTEPLTAENYYTVNNFSKESSQGVFLPDADLDALTRSILILESNEIALPHVRYHIRYSMHNDSEVPELTQDYIEINRYNLGPSRRADLLQYMESNQVAPVTEFGVGPHVSWRFVMGPVMGLQANLIQASRQEIPDSVAQQNMCFSQPCLSLEEPEIPDNLTLKPIELTSSLASSYVTHDDEGLIRPARVVDELWNAFNDEGMDPLPYTKDQPHFIFVISKDVGGQESNVLGLGQQTMVLDDSIAKVWIQRHEVAGGDVYFNQAFTPR